MKFRIEILGLKLFGFHGVLEHEKNYGQEFLVDIKLTVESSGEDQLEATVSYAEIADLVEASFNAERNDLLEALAVRLKSAVLSHSERIVDCEIAIHKPAAPLTQEFSDVVVTVLGNQQ